MSIYKLHYFNMRGRAEVARFLFAISGQEYEDIRIEKDDWVNQKANMPFHQIPVLEIVENEKSTFISQSFTIARFLARKFSLDGNSELEKAQVDMVVEQLIDLQNAFIKAHFEPDSEKKKELGEKLITEIVPQNLKFFEKIISSNKTNSGWFVGESLTLADVIAFNMWEWTRSMLVGLLDNFPLIKVNDEKVKSHEKIIEWMAKRPVTEM